MSKYERISSATPILPAPVLPVQQLNEEDTKLLAEMCSPDSETTLTIRSGSKPEDILRSLYIATRASNTLERKRDGLIQVIGKILWVCRNNPEVYQSGGFRSFDHFLKKHVVEALGMSKSTLRDAMGIYAAFPNVPASDVAAVGVVKMKLLAKLTNSTQPGCMKMIQEAKTMTRNEIFRQACKNGALSAGDVLRDVIVIECSKSQKHMAKQFFDHPQVRAKCQTEDWGTILEYMIAEVMGEWCEEDG